MLVNQKAIHKSVIAAATHEYINVFHIESQNHCIAVVLPPVFHIVCDKEKAFAEEAACPCCFLRSSFNILFP